MQLMVEEEHQGLNMCHAIRWYAKANNKYRKDYSPKKDLWYLMYWDVNNLYVWVMSRKLPLDSFKWRSGKFIFYEAVIQAYDENSDKGYIPKLMLIILSKVFVMLIDSAPVLLYCPKPCWKLYIIVNVVVNYTLPSLFVLCFTGSKFLIFCKLSEVILSIMF